jgi:hypothetical protein
MAVTVTRGQFELTLSAFISSGTGARHAYAQTFENDLKNSSGNFIFDRVFAMEAYSLTTAAGNLDIDLYDIGSAIDLGAGAGEDNLGLTHANAKIHMLAIRNKEISGGGTLRIDNGVTNAWTGILPASATLDLPVGGMLVTQFGDAGAAVTDASSHMLRLSAQSADCEIDVVFFSSQS